MTDSRETVAPSLCAIHQHVCGQVLLVAVGQREATCIGCGTPLRLEWPRGDREQRNALLGMIAAWPGPRMEGW